MVVYFYARVAPSVLHSHISYSLAYRLPRPFSKSPSNFCVTAVQQILPHPVHRTLQVFHFLLPLKSYQGKSCRRVKETSCFPAILADIILDHALASDFVLILCCFSFSFFFVTFVLTISYVFYRFGSSLPFVVFNISTFIIHQGSLHRSNPRGKLRDGNANISHGTRHRLRVVVRVNGTLHSIYTHNTASQGAISASHSWRRPIA